MAPKKKTDDERDLFVVVTPASTPTGSVLSGQIAEAGAEILKTHAHLFQPLTITYKA